MPRRLRCDAEVDMHLSLTNDLTPLGDLLQKMKDAGLHGVSVQLERGTI